ncbi:FAD-dependent monooxygenase [Amycolatopsis magusensis]|uniref:2-polyprenyl-6-methoxyphenol hydroxylase-like FAD-dependent oxidoreductase n=1 Tax=Amycolatopsis magusensis TaxID=882444 RepID=A0ABS4PZ09_9PSEU|nr:FAD-dependent monooxygenase [Amycolatopsis magusensis]MBP2184543.1 2-polyprenyl-6-methoxyphenol hydroxylase-like FAD-dependent oxidoreductase [Amycolatopsis magusensis]
MINNTDNGRRALVVGLGISGLSAAIRLRGIGWEPVLAERAPGRRTEGYFIGLFGAGTAAAARLGFLGDLTDRACHTGSTHEVDRAGRGRRCVGFHELPGTPRLLLRGDVEAAAFRALPPEVEIRYATEPVAIEQDDGGVEVTLRDTATGRSRTERFDLVVGADGVRSAVRELVFGPARVRRLNYMVGAVKLAEPVPGIRPGDGAVLAEVGRSMWLFPFTGTTPAALFSYRTSDVAAEFGAPPIDRLRAAFGPEPPGALLEAVLTEFERAERPLFDSAEQIRLTSWHRGRVVLLGDSAWCMTLYSGMGASAGMAGAHLLGTLLAAHPGRLDLALGEWERRLRPFVTYHQREALRQRQFFTPASRFQRAVRSTVLCGLKSPRTGGFHRWVLDTTAAKSQRMKSLDISAPIGREAEPALTAK